jgi:hypothetical protein
MKDSVRGRSEKQSSRQKQIIIVAAAFAALVIITLFATVIVLLRREPEVVYEPVVQLIEGPNRGEYERNLGGRGFVVTPENVEEVRQEIEALTLPPADRRFEFSKTATWHFPTSTTASTTAMVRNVVRNSRTVFFDVSIEDFGVVYVSPYMPLGSEHRNFALDEELPAGTYSAVVTYFLVDDDFQILTDVSVGVTIIIEG